MSVYNTKINRQSESYRSNYELMQGKVKELDARLAAEGGPH